MFPAVGCLLLAALFILMPKMIKSILLALLALAVIVVFGFEQVLEELVEVFRVLMERPAGRIAVYSVGLYLFAVHTVVFFHKTKLLTAAVLSLLAVFCAVMIFRELRLMRGKRRCHEKELT